MSVLIDKLIQTKREKDDEFYTPYYVVEQGINYYLKQNPNLFKDKTVMCPCDNIEYSKFWKFFYYNFDSLGLRKLIATCYQTYGFKKGELGTREKKNITVRFLDGNGDFRSSEVNEIAKEADFIITNPPFSLIGEMYSWLLKENKEFLIIGSNISVTYNSIFPKVASGEVKARRIPHVKFDRPGKHDNYLDSGNCCWVSNFKDNSDTRIELTKEYNPIDYPKYDNDKSAINVNKRRDIPKDYYGVMGVPISFLENYNPNQFTVISKQDNLSVNGKKLFRRILIRRNDSERK